MKVLLIEPGKPPRQAIIPQTLEAMQKAVGGLIQAVYPFDDPVALICNEEAKLEGLPLNRALRDEDGNIAGTFFLCGAPADSEDFTSLTDEQLAHYTNRFRFIEFYIQEVHT